MPMILAFLATAATAAPALVGQSVIGESVVVDFGAKGKVSVPIPKAMADYEPIIPPISFSPRGDAAAVQFCWNVATLSPLMCQVSLVRPSGQILNLKDGAVGPLLWTPDGQYLIGAGNNSVRLWNLSGGRRLHSPQPPNNQAGYIAQTGRISRLWLERGFLCVSARAEVFRSTGGNAVQQLSLTTRYALPTLRPLETVTLPFKEGLEAPCHRPQTEP